MGKTHISLFTRVFKELHNVVILLTAPAGGTAAPFDLCLGVFGRGELDLTCWSSPFVVGQLHLS